MMGLQMLAIAFLAVNIHHAWDDSSTGFALGYIVSRILLIGEYLRAAKHIPAARSLIYPMNVGFALGVTCWIISLWVPAPWKENALDGALEKARNTGRILIAQVWLYGHLPLVVGLAAAGIGIEHMVISTQSAALPDNERWLMAGSVGLCYLALAILHRTGVIYACLSRTRHRLFAAAAMLAIAVFGHELLPVMVMSAIALIALLQVILDVSIEKRAA